MPKRNTPLVNNNYYHVYNRGIAKQNIFLTTTQYDHFKQILNYYSIQKPPIKLSKYLKLNQKQLVLLQHQLQTKPKLVEIISYCLMPNHYHLLIRQLLTNGISNYLRLIGNSYTRYFNTLEERVGPLFQGRFKVIHIPKDDYLLHLSRYIHLNPLKAGITTRDKLEFFPHSSFPQYINPDFQSKIKINPQIILNQFPNTKDYYDFCLNFKDSSDFLPQIE